MKNMIIIYYFLLGKSFLSAPPNTPYSLYPPNTILIIFAISERPHQFTGVFTYGSNKAESQDWKVPGRALTCPDALPLLKFQCEAEWALWATDSGQLHLSRHGWIQLLGAAVQRLHLQARRDQNRLHLHLLHRYKFGTWRELLELLMLLPNSGSHCKLNTK